MAEHGDAVPAEPGGTMAKGRRRFDQAYGRADSALDRGQARVFRLLWLFLPDTSIARNPRFEQILASRFCSDAGQQCLLYGALIATVRGGGNALDSALVGVAALLPPALFGLIGGSVADQLAKRVALALFYNLQALICLVVPFLFGTSLADVLFLIFVVNLLGQVSGPSESSVVPLVANEEQLASAASLVSLSSNIGTAFGTAILAPILVRIFGVDGVFIASALMLFLAASRVFDLPTGEPERKFNLRRRPEINVRATIDWFLRERAVATMVFVAVLAGTASIVVMTLAPRYVQSVLTVDPADAVYVFAPSSLGLLAALVVTPPLVRTFNERPVALVGFILITIVLFSLGFIDGAAALLDRYNPMRLLEIVGIDISTRLRTAGLLAAFLGFGLALTQIAVQTYLNRRVPLPYQGRAFALQSVLKNATAIVPLLTLGAIATVIGVEAVLVLSPFLLLVGAFWLVRLSYTFGGEIAPGRAEVLASYWAESDLPVSAIGSHPNDRGPAAQPPPARAEPPDDG